MLESANALLGNPLGPLSWQLPVSMLVYLSTHGQHKVQRSYDQASHL